jgi:periplasmic protein TonB
MDTNKILSADLLDLLFDDRNKAYGAYELRRSYNKRIKKALFITATLTGVIIAGVAFASSVKPVMDDPIIHEVTIADIPDDPTPPPPPPPQELPPPEPVRTEQLTQMQIVQDDQVDEPLPTQDDLDKANIGVIKQDGIDAPEIIEPVDPGNGTGIVEAKKEKEPEIWTTVEIDAKFEGDWIKFLKNTLNANVPVDNGAPAGRYKVAVRFVVDVDGTVSDITPVTNVGFGMEQEAIRALKKAKKWEPAFQNGVHVKAYRTQFIVFEVFGDE